jgi:predicted TIM-barrel fold metal-dependent hydrolase
MDNCEKSEMNMKMASRRQFLFASTAAVSAASLYASPADERPKIIDAWGHVSLPRFLSAEEYLGIMDANGVEAAIVGTAATCPDLRELSRAAVQYGNRLCSIGMPMGRSFQERIECVRAQMECGFSGIRLQAELVVKEPELLEVVGKAGGVPYLEGSEGYRVAATRLFEFLERYPNSIVCATHFAGPTDPAIFSKEEAVARLFRHPRFLVIFSRQGYMDQEMLKVWTRAMVELTGWDRIMYGSEFPVALWRDETFRSTQGWIDTVGLTPTPAEREKFFYGNARRHFFQKQRPAHLIDSKWSRTDWKTDALVWLFVKKGMDLPEETHRKILRTYLAKGGDAQLGSYRDYVTRFMIEMTEKL